jgi:hypothetical protein
MQRQPVSQSTKRFIKVIQEIKTVQFDLGSNNRKCLVLSLNAETLTRLVWKDELHVAAEHISLILSFTDLDMEFCET